MPYELLKEDPRGRYEMLPPDKPAVDRKDGMLRRAAGVVADEVSQGSLNLLAGGIRGAGSIGATAMRVLPNFMGGDTAQENEARRKSIDEVLQSIGAQPDAWMYRGGKLGTELLGTAGAGGLLAKGASAIPWVAKSAAPLIDAIGSSGMTAGGVTGLAGQGVRAGGAAITGAASAGMVDPNDALAGGAIGAVTPAVLQGLGKAGTAVYNTVKGGRPNAGQMLADALGVSEKDMPKLLADLGAAPESIIPGSKLTVSQALQLQGSNTPGVKLLERIVAAGPGGDAILKRYQDQAAARMAALESQGAQTYQGAAKEEATRVGDKIGAVVRTQKADEAERLRSAWETLYKRGANEGVQVDLPLPEMERAMQALGPGTVGAGNDARAVFDAARELGTVNIPAVKPLAVGPVGSGQTLEQAVRGAGGIKPTGYLGGEIRDLGIRESGTTGLINSKSGKNLEQLAEMMHARGFIPDADPATLVTALRNGGGRKIYATDAPDAADNLIRARFESAMGDPPGASVVNRPLPFDELQRLVRSAGALAAKHGERAGGGPEAAVLNDLKSLLLKRVDEAAASGNGMSQGFGKDYLGLRDATAGYHNLYSQNNNIGSIVRKPVGQDFALTGDEITNKVWHGGAGLAGDVANLKKLLSANNYEPTMDALRGYIMTDAASKVNASGNLGAALPRYVETRMPGLLEALTPEQLQAVTGVAKDIQNSNAAGAVQGLLGSDTQAKISRSLNAGLLDTPVAKTVAKVANLKMGIGEALRSKLADSVVKNKGETMAALLADPKAAALALKDARFISGLDSSAIARLKAAAYRGSPLLATD